MFLFLLLWTCHIMNACIHKHNGRGIMFIVMLQMLQIKFTVFCSKAVVKSHYWWFFCVPLGEMDKHTTCYILSAPFQSCYLLQAIPDLLHHMLLWNLYLIVRTQSVTYNQDLYSAFVLCRFHMFKLLENRIVGPCSIITGSVSRTNADTVL